MKAISFLIGVSFLLSSEIAYAQSSPETESSGSEPQPAGVESEPVVDTSEGEIEETGTPAATEETRQPEAEAAVSEQTTGAEQPAKPDVAAAATTSAVPSTGDAYGGAYRLQMLMKELNDVESARAKTSLGGPIAITVIGGVALSTGASLVLISMLQSSVCQEDYYYDCGSYGCEPSSSSSSCGESGPLGVVGGVVALTGALTLTGGIIWIVSRAKERGRLGRRLKQLRREIDYQAQWNYDYRHRRINGMRFVLDLPF